MPLTAQNINIDPALAMSLRGGGASAYNKIKQGYGQAQGAFGADAAARGMSAGAATGGGSYYGTQAPISQGLAVGGLQNALGGGLANTSYSNALQQREFDQNADLARQAGALNKPDTLQEILAGLGGVGGAVGSYYGMKGKMGGNVAPPPSGPGSAWNIRNPGPLDLGYGGF